MFNLFLIIDFKKISRYDPDCLVVRRVVFMSRLSCGEMISIDDSDKLVEEVDSAKLIVVENCEDCSIQAVAEYERECGGV